MPKARHIHWNERAAAVSNARRELPALMTGYFARVRKLLAKDPQPAKLHRIRLATKRVRYTLELFRACYGPGLETRIQELRRVQQLLGEINDTAASGQLLAKAMKGSPQKKRVMEFLDGQAAAQAQEFRKHWTEVFDTPGQERWWTGYLAREARSPARRT